MPMQFSIDSYSSRDQKEIPYAKKLSRSESLPGVAPRAIDGTVQLVPIDEKSDDDDAKVGAKSMVVVEEEKSHKFGTLPLAKAYPPMEETVKFGSLPSTKTPKSALFDKRRVSGPPDVIVVTSRSEKAPKKLKDSDMAVTVQEGVKPPWGIRKISLQSER